MEIVTLEISLLNVFALLLAHLIGDFFLQSDKMATEKSSNSRVLLLHVFVYMMPFVFIALYALPFPAALMFLVVNFAAHYLTDSVSSRVTKTYYQQERRHEFFVTIGIDQFVHMVTLIVTFVLLQVLVAQ